MRQLNRSGSGEVAQGKWLRKDGSGVTALEKQSSMETESVLCGGRGEAGLFREGCPLPAHDWSIPMQVRTSSPHSLIGQIAPS